MNRLSILSLLCLGASCLLGQTSSEITISTSVSGARFEVDGVLYTQAVSFNWPTGSEHVVVFMTDPPLSGQTVNLVQTDGPTQYVLTGWEDNKGLVQPSVVPIQYITADPSITT